MDDKEYKEIRKMSIRAKEELKEQVLGNSNNKMEKDNCVNSNLVTLKNKNAKKKRGNGTRFNITDEILEASLRRNNGWLSDSARELGISRQAVEDRIKRNPYFQQVMKEIEENSLDIYEKALMHNAVKTNNVVASIFYLKTKGKKRGFIETEPPKDTGLLRDLINLLKPPEPLQEIEHEPIESKTIDIIPRSDKPD